MTRPNFGRFYMVFVPNDGKHKMYAIATESLKVALSTKLPFKEFESRLEFITAVTRAHYNGLRVKEM